jgi:hypothetical protein
MRQRPNEAILLPYHDPKMGRMWAPVGTRAIYDFRNTRGTRVPDLSQARRTRTLTNLVSNGNFASGTTGWDPTNATLSVASQILSITGNGGGSAPFIVRSPIQTATAGQQYYMRAKIRVTNALCTILRLYIADADYTPTLYGLNQSNPVSGQWYPVSSVVTIAAGSTGNVLMFIGHYYADAATANGKILEVDGTYGVMLHNLTTTFGAGNEPTAAEMDALLADNGVTYHDGAQVLTYQNYLTLTGPTDTGLDRFFDGVDDFGSAMNSPALDITALPIAAFTTVKIPTGTSTGWLQCKNLDAANNTQYGLLYNATNPHIDVYLNGAVVCSTANDSVTLGTAQDYGFIANGATAQAYINGRVSGASAAFTDALTSRPYFRFMRRETTTAYGKGNMDNYCLYASADASAILRHRQFFMRRVGVA